MKSKLNETHQILLYADDVNLFGDSVNTIKEKSKTLLEVSRDILFKKALTVLRGPLAYPNGLLDLHIETFW
jgi:hypothetical protein